MDRTEQQVIDELFEKISQAEAAGGPRDPGAERHIGGHLARQPAAPYYMAQAIVIQEQALGMALARVRELENELRARPAGGGGFLGGLFGGGGMGRPVPPPDTSRQAMDPRIAAYADPRHGQGGGFLGGAMQTAMGVAGGVLLGNLLMDMFSADPAMAAAAPADDGGFDDDGDDLSGGDDFSDGGDF